MLWESIDQENCAMDCTSFQMSAVQQQQPSATKIGTRRALMCNAADLGMDEFSFYDDDEAIQRQHTASPELMGLLSPEGSPQRFHIVSQHQTQLQHQQQQQQHGNNKFLQPLARQQKLQHTTTTTTSSTISHTNSDTPAARSLRVFNSLSSSGSMESSMDDEYMELFAMESFEAQNNSNNMPSAFNLPSNLNSLISGQIKHASSPMAKTPEMRRPSVRRCLSMTENVQPKTPEHPLLLHNNSNNTQETDPLVAATSPFAGNNYCFKRPEPPTPTSTLCSPVVNKRHRLADKENCNVVTGMTSNVSSMMTTAPHTVNHPQTLRKCMSMNDADILTALERSENKNEPELIGDFSKSYVLPLMEGRHRDLKSISSETVARLLRGDFNDKVASYKIIDCRYPYEYDGGHISGAKNLYTHEQIMEEFLTTTKTEQQHKENAAAGNKRNIIIFHCEFSSERGPKMSRFLRSIDRARNTNAYPALDYPEVYLLHNGYKDFFETHAELCQPESYRPMLEPGFNEAYRHFRAKSKSWNGDGLGGATGRLKKSRSRLML